MTPEFISAASPKVGGAGRKAIGRMLRASGIAQGAKAVMFEQQFGAGFAHDRLTVAAVASAGE